MWYSLYWSQNNYLWLNLWIFLVFKTEWCFVLLLSSVSHVKSDMITTWDENQDCGRLTKTSAILYLSQATPHFEMDARWHLRWLTTVFLRLSSMHYDCLPDISINHGCKNNASNPRKKRKQLQHLKGVKSLWYT